MIPALKAYSLAGILHIKYIFIPVFNYNHDLMIMDPFTDQLFYLNCLKLLALITSERRDGLIPRFMYTCQGFHRSVHHF